MSQTDLDGFQYACTYDLCHTGKLGVIMKMMAVIMVVEMAV